MVHLWIWREWNTFQVPNAEPGYWELWKTLPVAYLKQHIEYLRGLGLEVEYTGF